MQLKKNRIYQFISFIVILFFTLSCERRREINKKEQLGEYFGFMIWNACQSKLSYDEELNVEDVIRGLRKAANKEDQIISYNDFEEISRELQQNVFDKVANDNLKIAEEEINKFSSQKGVVELVKGKLYAKTLREGKGEPISDSSSERFYHIKCIDHVGQELVNTYKLGSPVSQDLNQAILGFKLGVEKMKIGELRQLYIHPDLGYGKIQYLSPNSLLKIEVELVAF